MAALYSAGSVGVDVVPVTDKFFAELRAKMARVRDLTVGVDFEPNTLAYDRESGRINGRTLTNTVKIEGDASGIQRIRRAIEEERNQFENMTFSVPRFDTKDAARQIDKFVDDVDKKIATVSKKGKGIDFAGYTDRSLAHVHENLQRIADLEAERRKVNEQYEDARAREDDKAQKSAAARIKSIDDEIHQLNAKKDTYIHTLSEIRRAQDEYAKYVDEFNKRIRGIEVTQPYETLFQKAKLREQTQEYKDASAELAKARDEYVKRVSELVSGRKWVKGSDLNYDPLKYLDYDTKFVKDLNDSLKQLEQQEKAVAKANKLSDLNKDLATWRDSMSDTARNTNSARKEMSDYRSEAKKATDLLDDQEKELVKLQRAMAKFKPYGTSRELNKEINDFLADLRRVRREVQRNPIKAKVTLDDGAFQERFADLIYDANNALEKLDEQHTIDIRFSHWEDDAERLEDRLDRLTHQRVDIPVEWQVDQQRIISRMREIAEEIKRNPDRAVELEANLDLDMKRAEERLKDFEKEHDKLDMDLDLQTRLAQAHLAWFTRPRTVDIYANFKGTDLGKIINGMTSGATGINYVNNQFQKLVNLMDSLDRVIPKWSLLGSVVLSLGAGLTNLMGTVGGIGESLVSMSSAALAAPAALGGLVSIGYGLYSAYTLAGEGFGTSIDKLTALTDVAGWAFWDEASEPMTRMVDSILPTLDKGLSDVAASEGRVASGLAGIVTNADEAGKLESVFSNTTRAVDNLNPGLQSLIGSLLTLGDETSVYLPRMSTYVSNLAAQFAAWVDEAQRTGEITASLDRAIEQGGYLVDIFGSLKGILSGTFGTFAQYENGLQGFSEAIESANRAVNSIKFQDVLNELIAGAQTAQDTVRDSFSGIGDDLWSLRGEMRNAFEDAGTIVASVLSNVSEMLADSGDGIRDFTDGLASGWSKAMDAVGDSGPVFSDLLSMVGQLSDTFGGTFAAGLRTVGPLLSSIAKVTETVAEAFDSLPEPLKQAITMYATFGRATKSALDTVKTSMLQNISQILQYQRALNQLGVASKGTSIGFRDLISAYRNMNAGRYDVMFTNTAKASTTLATSTTNAAKQVATASKSFGGLKGVLSTAGNAAVNAGGAIVSALGGPVMLGISASIGLVTAAMSDYQSRANATAEANARVAGSLSEFKVSADEAAGSFDTMRESISSVWSNEDYLQQDWFTDMFDGVDFKNVAEEADVLGISLDDLTNAAMGSDAQYSAMQKTLKELGEQTQTTAGPFGIISQKFTDSAVAAQNTSSALQKVRDEYKKAADDIKDYVNSYDMVSDTASALDSQLSRLSVSWRANSGSLDANTEAGKRNIEMLNDVASSAITAAEQTLAYGAANGDMETATQDAINILYQARESIIDTMTSTGMAREEAEKYADSLGLIPGDVGTKITADTELSRQQIENYLDLLDLMPEQKDMILALDDQGAITDINSFNQALIDVVDGQYVAVLTADNQQVYLKVDQAKKIAKELEDGTYKTTLDAEDLASGKINDVIKLMQDANIDSKNMKLLLDADDNASDKITNALRLARVFGLTSEEIELIANTDNADASLDGIKQKLRDIGLNDSQIEVLLEAIDKASPVIDGTFDDFQQKFGKPMSFDIQADDSPARTTMAALQSEPDIQKKLDINGDSVDAEQTYAYMQALADVIKWMYMYGNNDDARTKFNDADALKFVDKWAMMYGNNNDVQDKMRQVRAYDGVVLARAWGNIDGDDSQWRSVRSAVANTNGSIIATNYVKIATTGDGAVHAATGGRISGPGTSTSDSIPAMLSNGEYVMRAAAVRKIDERYGAGFLDYVNRMGKFPTTRVNAMPSSIRSSYAYANGGRVRADNVDIDINPVVNVKLPENAAGMVVNQTFDTKVVRSNQDLYTASTILHRNALNVARNIGR